MAFRRHNPQWQAVYRDDNNTYDHAGDPVFTGGAAGYNTLIGFNSAALLDDINASQVRPRIHLRYNVVNAGEFDLGMHKSSTDKGTDGIPFYRYTGNWYADNVGQVSHDITEFNITFDGVNTFEEALNNGFHGPVLYGAIGGAFGEATDVYIEVEGIWNQPPTTPTLTFPTGGETLSGETTFTANPATDPEGDSLTYQFYLKDGETTHYFSRGPTERTVDLSNYVETSTAQVGVRAYDGQSYSAWDESGVFTIRHNTPPSQPTLIEPVGGVSRDRTKTIRFLWNHNDQDPQSLFRFRWRIQGTSTWTEQETVTTDELVAIPGGTFPEGTIEWQVQTEDQGGLISPWSSSGLFTSTQKSDAPTITSPENGATIPTESLTVTWSSSGQVQYEVEVLDGSTVHWESTRSSGNKGVTVGEPLANSTTYTVRVRIADDGGLWSDWASVTVTTSFTQPTQAELSVSTSQSTASIYVDISNPLPSGTQPNVAYNDLYRRHGNTGWIRIATGLEPNSGFRDYTPAGGVTYEYLVTTYGDNNTTMDSVPVIGSVTITGAVLSIARIPTEMYITEKLRPFEMNDEFTMTEMAFAGRKRPTVEFGEVSRASKSIELIVPISEFPQLRAILSAKQTILYRDMYGDKRFIGVPSIQTKYLTSSLYNVTIENIEVDFTEEV